MPKIINADRGIYILEIYASQNFQVNIKRFKDETLIKGYYYYIGSAQKNLRHRLLRHLRQNKIIHWHIDNLTTVRTNEIKGVYLLPNKTKEYECRLVQKLIKRKELDFALEGFGNSDCNKCNSHLLYSRNRIPYSHFISLYQSTVRLIPSSIETSCL